MKHFMIRYQFANGTTEAWHQEIGRFISALNDDPELKGKIVYRCLKNRDDSGYTHLAAAVDEQAIKTLQGREFFKHYTEKTPAGRRRRGRGDADGADRGDHSVFERSEYRFALRKRVRKASLKPSCESAATDGRGRTAW